MENKLEAEIIKVVLKDLTFGYLNEDQMKELILNRLNQYLKGEFQVEVSPLLYDPLRFTPKKIVSIFYNGCKMEDIIFSPEFSLPQE